MCHYKVSFVSSSCGVKCHYVCVSHLSVAVVKSCVTVCVSFVSSGCEVMCHYVRVSHL